MEITESKTRQAIYNLIEIERDYQDRRFGEQNHNPFYYLSILNEEVGECFKECNDRYDWVNGKFQPSTNFENLKKELIQVAAVAVAVIECLERRKFKN